VTSNLTLIKVKNLDTSLKPLLYTPDWLISFEKEVAGAIVLNDNPGMLIRDYRVRYDMSQGEFGELMGLCRESISRIENGGVMPTFEFVKKFIKTIALIEAIRVERAQHKEIDVYFLENLAKELRFNREKLTFMLKIAIESYDKKHMKIQKSLEDNTK